MTTQEAYSVNCSSCGKIVEVVNPLIGKRPRSVKPVAIPISLEGKIVTITCPQCDKPFYTKFLYYD